MVLSTKHFALKTSAVNVSRQGDKTSSSNLPSVTSLTADGSWLLSLRTDSRLLKTHPFPPVTSDNTGPLPAPSTSKSKDVNIISGLFVFVTDRITLSVPCFRAIVAVFQGDFIHW